MTALGKAVENLVGGLASTKISRNRRTPVPVRVVPNKRARRRTRRQRRATTSAADDFQLASPGVVSGPVAGPMPFSNRSAIPALQNTGDALPDYTVGWLERHLDPCGEYRTSLDWGKIPDGTLPQSVSGQFREVFTIRHPGSNANVAPLEGRMWALYIMSLPMWRTPFLFIADMDRPEVGDDAVASALRGFNNALSLDAVAYPNWVSADIAGVYWTVQLWSALRDAPMPSDLGVSPLITDFRITGEGFTFAHNTPSLINQGIAVISQFNPNTETRDIAADSEASATELDWSVTTSNVAGSVIVNWRLPGISAPPSWGGTVTMTAPTSGTSSNSSALPAASEVFTIPVEGVETIVWTAGDVLRFTVDNLTGSNLTRVTVQVQTGGTGAFVPVPTMTGTGVNFVVAMSGSGILALNETHTTRYNVLTVPPVTQEDLIQQTPKTVQYLLKETDGFYVAKRAWQPVFSMTSASSYAKIRFIDRSSSAEGIAASAGTIQDTVDHNYGYAVANITSLPLAAAPYIKAIRSWECIPTRRSVWGPFTTSTTPKDENALIIAKTISDLDPFAYPLEYNGLGMLFKKVVGVVQRIPKWLRTGANVAECVANVATNVQAGVESVQLARQRDRGTRRAAVVQ